MPKSRSHSSRALAITLLAPLLASATPVPLPANAILQELRSFRTTGTVLHVGAHPDDENTELITYLARGRGYRTAYLSLTRGDGGQNELGRDFDEKLGVLRTQELLAARQLDRGRQFFTRAIDFGYSKSPEETLRFWDRDQVLADVVRVIRRFQPDVIVTRFPIPPGSGGHGHHTASAILAVEAFGLAGDPLAYPEQLAQGLTVWQPRRVLWNSFRMGSNTALDNPIIKLDIAGADPITGEAFGAIAGRSRAMHKTQSLGGFASRANLGPNLQSFMLLAGEPISNDPLDGIDTTWARVPGAEEIDQLTATLIERFSAGPLTASVPALLQIRTRLAQLPASPLVDDKRAQLDQILQSCLGLRAETTVGKAEVVPGEALQLTYSIVAEPGDVSVRYHGTRALTLAARTPTQDAVVQSGAALTGSFEATLPTDLPLTQPYWLREEGAAGIARVDDPQLIGLPENPPAVPVEHFFSINGQSFALADEPVFIVRDDSGEQRRRLAVISPVSLALAADVYAFTPGATKDVVITVTTTRAAVSGTLQLTAPADWIITPAGRPFSASTAGTSTALSFAVTAPDRAATGQLSAIAEVEGHLFSHQRQVLRYAHLAPQLLQPPARARLVSFELETRGRVIGYLPGAGDAVAESLEQMGFAVRILSGSDLSPAGLAGLDAVVIGVRAFNERDDLGANLPGLFAWVEEGGTVIAQYNRPNRLRTTTLAPYALSIEGPAAQWRVTDEQAAVEILAPDHPALTTPNRLGPADWAGWVQERGAYFPSSWDESRFTPLFAMHDAGEAPLRSSVLIARHGQGHYVYTSLALFRQLPAGVPGAYRLLANLIALGK